VNREPRVRYKLVSEAGFAMGGLLVQTVACDGNYLFPSLSILLDDGGHAIDEGKRRCNNFVISEDQIFNHQIQMLVKL
jgi:hypothetical protein